MILRQNNWESLAATVYGFGVTDVNSPTKDHNSNQDKIYKKWVNCIERSKSASFKTRNPSYKNVNISDDWKYFYNFYTWFTSQPDYENSSLILDKDLLVFGNLTYSSETCCLIPIEISNFIVGDTARKGQYMIGVSKCSDRNKFLTQVRNPITKQRETLGRFNTELEAHLAWKHRKQELAGQLCNYTNNPLAKKALESRYLIDMSSF